MRYSIYINQVKAQEWELNLSQTILFAFLYELPSWANTMVLNGSVYYFCTKSKIIEELPMLTDKEDSVYRLEKSLQEKGLIMIIKIDGKDYISLTEKAQSYNSVRVSENYPKEVGKFSDNQSENFPTDNNTIKDKEENDKVLFPDFDKTKQTKFRESLVFDETIFRNQFKNVPDVDIGYYYTSVLNWSDKTNKKRTARGWIATAQDFMRSDKEAGKLKLKKQENANYVDFITGTI